jgi:hypothetical protein
MQIRFSRVLLFVAMTVSLTACPGGSSGVPPTALGDTLIVSAKIANWTASKTGIVKVPTTMVGTPDQVVLGESPIADDGAFTITIPASAVKDNLVRQFRDACTTYTVSPPDFKYIAPQFRVHDASGKQIGYVFLATQALANVSPPGTKVAIYFYADQSFSAKGPCFSSSYQQNWDINGLTGWNVVIGETISTSGEVNYTSTPVSTDLKWYFTSIP